MAYKPSYYTSLFMVGGQVMVLRTVEKPPRRILELASLVVPAIETPAILDEADDISEHILKDRFGLFDPGAYRPLTTSEAIRQVEEFAKRLGVSF